MSDAYNFIVDNGKTVNFASYVNGTVNGYTESYSVEAFVPYDGSDAGTIPSISALVRYRHVEGATASVNTFINVCQANNNIIEFDC